LYVDRRFVMASTRLSIIDLAAGDQPLSDERGRYWVMQNGEIFNHPELRTELEACGHRFATHSDTEVLAHAYEEWGAECLARLNGEFAFAVWDRAASELFLGRDRFGIRPLFLLETNGVVAFASEAKALLRHPLATRELNPAGVLESFLLWAGSPARSAFIGIRELPPGHYLRVGPPGVLEERRWWDMPFTPREEQRDEPEAELAEELRELLDDATRIRLRADVPVGTYLSGGLDSSAITAMAQRLTRHPVRTFGIGFADPDYDESVFQDQVARALGTELTRLTIDGPEIAELMPRVVVLSEKPTLRTAPAPLLKLSRAARDAGYKVVLTGEGADEMFAGYDVFKLDKVRRFWARHPESKYRPLLLRRLYPYLAQDLARAGAMLHNVFGAGLSETDDPLYSHRLRFDHAARALRFFEREALARAVEAGDPREELRARLPADYARFTPLGRAQYLEVITFMCGYLLHSQGDRMLMGHSVEGRFPFLDYRVAEFAGRLPDRMKLVGLREKSILRQAVGPLLPRAIARREKRPYRAPILGAFVGRGSPAYVDELLQPDRLRGTGLFSSPAVGLLLQKCRRNEAQGIGVSESDEMALVGVLSTMLLHEHLVARPTLAPPATPNRVVIGAAIMLSTTVGGEATRETESATAPA
ncbi:MAG: asparagine synthase, partial [Geminicoccaceae bacterium]|nr:asparagine synthase [Geminicoccaceae bacterium]